MAMNRMNRRVVGAGCLVVTSLVLASGASSAAVNRVDVQSARSNVSSNANVNANRNVNTNVNRNTNVNVNRDVNVHGGYGGGYDRWGHPIATAASVTATAVAVGTVASTLPSSGCSAVAVGGASYQRCGPNYYQPVYQGGGVQYVVVAAPQ
jgi:hypothetical protein